MDAPRTESFNKGARSGCCPGALTLATLLAACAGRPFPYKTPYNLNEKTGAVLMVRSFNVEKGVGWDIPIASASVSIYDSSYGCPDLNSRLPGSGYLGTLQLGKAIPPNLLIPAARRVVFESFWRQQSLFGWAECYSVMEFVPERASTYVYVYEAPTSETRACGAVIKELVDGAGGKDELQHVDDVVHHKIVKTFRGYETPFLCDRDRKQ
jgi:hypothetical protein